MDFNFDWVAKNQLLAGAAGGFIAAFRFTPGATFAAKVVNGTSGMLFSIFCGQLLFWWFGLQHPGALAGVSFVLGLLGMALTDAAIKAIAETKLGEFVNSALGKLFGGNTTPKE